jgi:hypothetical protein
MKIYENGVYRDATEEEIARFEAAEPEPVENIEDRIASLEEELEAAKVMLGVE